jgi:hypothetical protein
LFLPDKVETIAHDCFGYCSELQAVEMGKNVIAIESFAFRGCTSLETMRIPQSLKVMRRNCFAECTRLKTIVFAGSDLVTILIAEMAQGIPAYFGLPTSGDLRIEVFGCNIFPEDGRYTQYVDPRKNALVLTHLS